MKKKCEKVILKDLFSITTYTEVCKLLGIKEKILKDFSTIKEYRYHQILNIQKLYNSDSKFNYYYPYFTKFRTKLIFECSFYYHYYGFSTYNSVKPEIAYFKNNKTSDYVGKIFKFIYEDLI